MAREDTIGADERRRFIRHPSRIPIRCRKEGRVAKAQDELHDVSYGGLMFVSPEAYAPGDVVEIEFPSIGLQKALKGEIVWSTTSGSDEAGQCLNGLKFMDELAHFHARVVEQICHIEAYRQAQREEHGRELTPQQAAEEWIQASAGKFPH